MDNIINPAGQVRSVSHRGSRWARLWIAVVAAGVVAGAARAQTSYTISTLAGQPNSPGAVDAIGAAARFRDPASVVADSAGNLYVADTTNHAVRKVVVSTGAVTTVAGLLGTSGTANGAGTVARFNLPQGLALDAGANKLYVADTFNHTIRVIDLAPATPVVTTLAGGAGTTGSTNATGTAARFNYPYGLALSGGNLYVADSSNQSIRKIVVASGVVTTLAGPDGTGSNVPGTQGFVDSATPASARFFNPIGLAADNANLYVADKSNNRIRKVVLATGEVSTLAGAATAGAADGTGVLATFNGPEGLAIDSNGSGPGTTLLVADTLNHTLRRVVIATGAVTTLAGTAGSGSFADGLGTAARFTRPTGIALDSASNLYVADNATQLIRRGTVATAPAITSANNATFALGSSGSFTFTATGTPAPTFSVSAGTLPLGLSLSSAGVLSGVPASAVGSPFSFTVQASNGVAPAATQVFTLTVNQPPVITSAATTTFVVGNAATSQVVATGSPAPTFSITAGSLPATVAFMNAAGLITAAPPSTTAGSPFTFTITATNTGGSTTQVFTLNVSSGPTISTQPAAATVAAGVGAQFSVVAAANGGGTLTVNQPPVITSAASPDHLVLSARTGVAPDSLQPFTLVISPVALA
ncbi:MAG: putative Ig domain-containing protein, partial [Verrucomicrobiota bacterium]